MNAELPLDDDRLFPCWFCGTLLKESDYGPREHCDSTPPRGTLPASDECRVVSAEKA